MRGFLECALRRNKPADGVGEEALLQDGVITAVGTHRELLARDPVYRELMSADSVTAGRPGQRNAGGAGPGPERELEGTDVESGARR